MIFVASFLETVYIVQFISVVHLLHKIRNRLYPVLNLRARVLALIVTYSSLMTQTYVYKSDIIWYNIVGDFRNCLTGSDCKYANTKYLN